MDGIQTQKSESSIGAVEIQDLGILPYAQAYAIQKQSAAAVLGGGVNKLLLCEHPAVLTLGRLATEDNILFSKDEIARRGVSIVAIDRGGEVTLHSPGQLVAYPILDLRNFGKDLKSYMRRLEQVGIDFLREFDILADRNSGRTGVWVGEKKIASIGIGVRQWVAYHGIGINVNTDLNLFSLIRPCGLDVRMTSLAEIKGSPVDMKLAKEKLTAIFCREFQLQPKITISS